MSLIPPRTKTKLWLTVWIALAAAGLLYALRVVWNG